MAVSRKTVTVLFADVADSTVLGELREPEVVRASLAWWFDEARAIIERHGGTVEKYIGDSVMAVFGIPRAHEDDALRALRAASELSGALVRLNEELERERGFRFTVRMGINTGEVVAGDGGGTLVTGDAVNVAKRLEEAAGGGEIVVGDSTHDLARASATFEPLEPLTVKGKSSPLRAWRLVHVSVDGVPFERRLGTPLVGRQRELEQLRRAYRRSVTERTCHLFTLLGTAGIGKTRLACELFDEVGDEATVLTGRCLPYGDGITFWPLTDVLQEVGDITPILERLDDAELVRERLRGLTGETSVASQEMFWAVRTVFESVARERSLVLCFEDIHWAEPTFLDLIEYLAAWIRDAPILLLCIARPEFLDERPAWLSGQENAASLTLSPLPSGDTEALLDALGVSGEERGRIAVAAEGNPLYVEQMAAMVGEGVYAKGMFSIPPTIQALLAARLDRLTQPERETIERAAVCGKEFWRDAVVALTPADERDGVGTVLMSLMRKDLIRPHRSAIRPDDAFRFSHVLIRDAAYAAIPKETRAALHEAFAEWTKENAENRMVELEEIIGYHLEQAFRYREQLGPLDDAARRVGEHAGELLGNAGRRAFARDDARAAVNLLDRAMSLLTEQAPARLELAHELGLALWSVGEVARAETLLRGVIETATATGAEQIKWDALLGYTITKTMREGDGREEALRVAQDAIQVFERLRYDAGLARAWRHLAGEHALACRFGESQRASEQALEYARKAHDIREESRAADRLCTALLYGPARVDSAVERCEQMLVGRTGNALLEANVRATLAGLYAMDGRFDEARAAGSAAESMYEDLGLRFALAGLTQVLGPAELLAGDSLGAEKILRRGYEILRDLTAIGFSAALLAEALYAQERLDEAAELAALALESAPDFDIAARVLAAGVSAKVTSRAGDGSARARAAEAVRLARETDATNLIGEAHTNHACVLRTLGDEEAAKTAAHEATAAFRGKGNWAALRALETTFATLSI